MLKIKKSQIPGAGKGLYTTTPIKKGEVVVEYKGKKCTWKQFKKKYGKDIHKAPYLFFISYKHCIDAQDTPQALARYANDAKGSSKVKGLRNNCDYNIIKGKPYIVAMKNIPAGAEILVDYAGDYWEMNEKNKG